MNLVIQGLDVATPDLKHLARISGASRIERLFDQSFRLIGAEPSAAVAEYCAQAKLDWGHVPPERRLADYGLLVMDMDSTLITIECIDEIADMVGVKAQVAAITAAAMRGELDFAGALRRRVGLLAGLDAGALQRVYDERLRLSPGAERMLAACRRQGLRTLLVSGGFTFFTDRVKTRCGLDHAHANTLEIVDGKLTGRVLGDIVDAQEKAAEARRMRERLGLGAAQVIAMGDGANDLAFMTEAGLSVAYHAKPVVRAKADYALDHVGLDGMLALAGERAD